MATPHLQTLIQEFSTMNYESLLFIMTEAGKAMDKLPKAELEGNAEAYVNEFDDMMPSI